VRVLFISHDASLLGAPRSLDALLAEFIRNTEWECRIVIRARPWKLSKAFSQYGETYHFYKYGTPRLGILSALDLMNFIREIKFNSDPLSTVLAPIKQKLHVKTIREKLSRWEPDLIYSNTAMNGDVIRTLNLNAPVLVHVRELEWFLKTLDPKRRQALRSDPAFYFAVSEAVKRNLLEKHHLDANKIGVVHVGINPRRVMDHSREISSQNIRKQLGFEPDTIVVGTVGRVDRRKGSDLFVGVATEMLKQLGTDSKIAFMWVGDGPDRAFVTQALRRQGVVDKLRDYLPAPVVADMIQPALLHAGEIVSLIAVA